MSIIKHLDLSHACAGLLGLASGLGFLALREQGYSAGNMLMTAMQIGTTTIVGKMLYSARRGCKEYNVCRYFYTDCNSSAKLTACYIIGFAISPLIVQLEYFGPKCIFRATRNAFKTFCAELTDQCD